MAPEVVIAQELLEALVCPRCAGRLTLCSDLMALVCEPDRLRYPIFDGVPMLTSELAESY